MKTNMLYHFVTLLSLMAVATLCSPSTTSSESPNLNLTAVKRDSTLKPVMNGQNFPDPAMIRIGNEWYAFATNAKISGKVVHVQMAHTKDFENWTHLGQKDALPNLPSWVDKKNPRVWAPDVVQLGPNKFVLYFTAALASNTALHCLGVATSNTVLGPYTNIANTPWICPTSQGGAIDPAGYYDASSNTRYVVYKIDGNAIGHGGICNNGIKPITRTPILLQQVSLTDGFSKLGSAVQLLTNDIADGPVVEAPSLSKTPDGRYILFFSSNCFATPNYDVSFATARNIRGPYTKFGPMMVTGFRGLTAPGGLDVAVNGDHAVFHADWNGGRAMFTALIRGTNPRYTAFVKT